MLIFSFLLDAIGCVIVNRNMLPRTNEIFFMNSFEFVPPWLQEKEKVMKS